MTAFRYLIALLLCAAAAAAQEYPLNLIELEPVVSGLDSPTAITHAGDGSNRLFITERGGRVLALAAGAMEPTVFLDISGRVKSGGEQGLFSVAFDPNFADSGFFFVNYSGQDGQTVVSRFQVGGDPNQGDPASEVVYLTQAQPFTNHNGGQLVFGPDGYLYIGMGDGGGGGDPGNRAQDLTTLLGKMLRVDVSGPAPAQPAPGNPFAAPEARPEIWALGLRNPWRFSFDRTTDDLFIADVGQDTVEEVSLQLAGSMGGENYGWRRMEGSRCHNPFQNCNTGLLTLPILEYTQQQGRCSVTGGYVYRGQAYPWLDGIYFFGDFCTGEIWGALPDGPGPGVPQNAGWRALEPLDTDFRISTFGEDEAGELYVADFTAGAIYRIAAPPGLPLLSLAGLVNAASFDPGLPLAAGAIGSLFVPALSNGIVAAPAIPLATQLDGLTVRFNGIPAPLYLVAPSQFNLQIPWELAALDQATITALRDGVVSPEQLQVALARVSPGIFTLTQTGSGQAAALISGAAGAIAAPAGAYPGSRAARIGEALEIFVTGLGATTNQPLTGEASPGGPLAAALAEVTVRVGVEPARVLFAGLTPGLVGLYQVNVELVGDFPSGDAIEIVLTVDGVESNPATIAIE